MTPSTNSSHWFHRLISADALLASREGLTIRAFAEQHGVSTKTVTRDLQFLTEFSDIFGVEEEFNRRRWWYADRRRRVFQAWVVDSLED